MRRSTSLIVADDGTPLSRSRYDPFGSVAETQVWDGGGWQVAATAPISETDYLYRGDWLERSQNIYFTGDNRRGASARYYDPWLGKYLQPDPIGGPPLLPQAADRYQYAGNSPVGCGACGQQRAGFPTAEAIGLGKDILWEVLGREVVRGRVRVVASKNALTRRLPQGIRTTLGYGRSVEGMAQLADGRYVALGPEMPIGSARALAQQVQPFLPAGNRPIAVGEVGVDEILREDAIPGWNVFDFGLDFVLGTGFQLAEDVGNPRLTSGQVWGRAAVAGGGGALSSLAGGTIGAKVGLAVSPLCGPGAPVCVVVFAVGGEFVGGWAWQRWGQPLFFERWELEQAPLRLKPLTVQ